MSNNVELKHRAVTYAQSLAQLQGAQKSSAGAPAYSRYINRPLGRRFAAVGHVLGATPNQVTAVSALLTYTGIAIIALLPPSWWSGLAVSAALVVGYALDAADGQLARLRGGGSLSGEWLDHVVDAGKISALHLAVLIGAARFTDLAMAWLLVPIVFTLVANVTFFGMILNGLLRDRHTARTGQPVDRPRTSTLRSLLVIPTDYGLLCLVFLLLGAPMVFGVVYAWLLLCSSGFLALALMKWYRDMSQLGAS